ELADVLDPLRPFGALRLERGDEPDLLDQQLDQLTDGRTCGKIPEPGDQAGERDERGGPGAAQQLAFLRACRRVQRRQAALRRPLHQPGLAQVADAAARVVHDAIERAGIAPVRDQAEIREHVHDLAPLVEARAPHDLVWQVVAAERLFQRARLRVGPVQHDEVAAGALGVLRQPALDLGRDPLRLVLLVDRIDSGDPFAGPRHRAQRLALAASAVRMSAPCEPEMDWTASPTATMLACTRASSSMRRYWAWFVSWVSAAGTNWNRARWRSRKGSWVRHSSSGLASRSSKSNPF